MGKGPAGLTTAPLSHEPKRERGRQRVEAIFDGAAEVFAEKGFDSATMTEIAARSRTAIGSLYRFFPTKESLGEFVTARAVEHVERELAAIAERAGDLSPAALADELFDVKLSLGKHRAAAVAFAEARGIHARTRQHVVTIMREQITKMLVTGTASLSRTKAKAVAVVIVHILEAAAAINEDQGPDRERSLAEIRELCRLYVSSR